MCCELALPYIQGSTVITVPSGSWSFAISALTASSSRAIFSIAKISSPSPAPWTLAPSMKLLSTLFVDRFTMASWNLFYIIFFSSIRQEGWFEPYGVPEVVVHKHFARNGGERSAAMFRLQVCQSFRFHWLLKCHNFELELRLRRPYRSD
jgi:hypothetical protein